MPGTDATAPGAHRDLRDLLAEAADAHHVAHPEPDHAWAPWYARYLHEGVRSLTVSDPSIDTLEVWLTEAEARFTHEGGGDWPDRYAAWILEWDEAAATDGVDPSGGAGSVR